MTTWNRSIAVIVAVATMLCALGCEKKPQQQATPAVTVQLNWLHDPTFVAQYVLEQEPGARVTVREGGQGISPIGEVVGGRAHYAIVGADIFLQHLAEEGAEAGKSTVVCVFVDFQRNPVGWVLHPSVGDSLGLSEQQRNDPRAVSTWAADKIKDGSLSVGDKRGTESTSVWLQWRTAMGIPDTVALTPVSFDPSVVLSAPKMLYPVYLNEQPFKLTDRIGRPVIEIDPRVNGVKLYGNVVIARRDFVEANPELVSDYQTALRKAWERVRDRPGEAAVEVARRYTGVPAQVVEAQVRRTVEFVFVGTPSATAGSMDTAEDGLWTQTLQALQSGGSVKSSLTKEQVFAALVPPK